MKSGEYLHLGAQLPNEHDREVNLFNEQTGWIVNHFAAYIPHSEKFVKVRKVL